MNSPTDRIVNEYLILRCQDGDATALSSLIRTWQQPFQRYASIVTKDPDLAADVVQEAWIKIIKALPRLKDPVSFQAWAYRIVNNQCMDVLRKRSTQYRETNVPKGMVKSRLFNARDKFRILLTGNKEGETHEPARQTNRSANSGSLANSI